MFCSGENHFHTQTVQIVRVPIHVNSSWNARPASHPPASLQCPRMLPTLAALEFSPGSQMELSWCRVEPHPAYVDHAVLPRARWLSVLLVATIITGEPVNLIRGGRGKRQTRWKRSYVFWELIMQGKACGTAGHAAGKAQLRQQDLLGGSTSPT